MEKEFFKFLQISFRSQYVDCICSPRKDVLRVLCYVIELEACSVGLRKIFSGFESLKALKFGARALPLRPSC